MKERLLNFIEYKGLKNIDFEKKVGLSNGFVNNIGDSVREKTITKIKNVFPELDVDWWKTGHGNMLINQDENLIIKSHVNGNHNINNNGGNVTISHTDFSGMIELQKELTERLKTSQNQLSQSQNQINTLLEILKKRDDEK